MMRHPTGHDVHYYRVGYNDTLQSISEAHYGTDAHAHAIWDLNRHVIITPNSLTPGMDIILPHVSGGR